MLKKIGVSLLFCLLVGCSSTPEVKTHKEISAANEGLKLDAPEYIPFTVKGLKSVECIDNICTMTEDDFRQNQHDKRALFEAYKLNHFKNTHQVQAYNVLVDAITHHETAITKKDAAIQYLERALDKERTHNAVKSWVERLLFIGGIAVFGTL